MARETVTLQPAYVLHQRAFRDTSRIVDLLCPDYGRVALVARGVQRPRSPLRSLLMPFRPVVVSWVRRGDLGTLTQAEASGPARALPPAAMMPAWYLNELLLRLVQGHDAQRAVFALYHAAIERLAEGGAVEPALRWFEKNLLDELGYGVMLSVEHDGVTPVAAAGRYRYRDGRGPERASAHAADEELIDGAVLLAMADDRFDDADVARQARGLLHRALAEQLGDRPLRVRDVARELKRVSASARPPEPSESA